MNYYIGIDIGGTNTQFAILDEDGRPLAHGREATAALGGGEALPANLAAVLRAFVRERGFDYAALQAVGAGTPGIVDSENGISVLSVNLGYRDFPMAARLGAALDRPVFISNDVKMYTYGEALKGAGRGYGHVMGITIGTGIAAAMVANGRLYEGGGFAAGEIGHIPIAGIHERCVCGLTGCLEIYVSAPGMARQAREALAAGSVSALAETAAAGRELTAADISVAYDAGDALAARIFRQTAAWLADGLAAAVPLYSPDAIIVGGGVAKAGERLLAPLREELAGKLLPFYAQRLAIKQAEWNDEAGLIGSAMYAKERTGRQA